MRRGTLLLIASAALICVAPAAARFVPVEHSGPRVTAGTLPTLTGGAAHVRVIVDLPLPPLATRGDRGLFAAVARRKLDIDSSSSRAYLRRIEQEQTRAAAQIRAAIPQARIGPRFQVVLDALTVSLPASRLPALVRQPLVTRVYPSLQYTLALDQSPSVIGADVLRRTTGADGTGIKIAVVDDGIDETNPFFNPAGFSYPSGFPRGITNATTPKVIVARVFPGPNAGKPGRLPVDPASSFHGTHVAGIAAGDSGTTAPAGSDHPTVVGLSGVAPRAWLGNYRVFTVPTPLGHVANTPEIVAAFEAAVKDGMDVINFSGGGPQIDPANDALIEAVHDAVAAGVVVAIAAGNDRDDFGLGSDGSPGTAPDGISVAATSNSHVFAPSLDVTAAGAPSVLEGIPFMGADGSRAPVAWGSADQQLVDVGTIVGTDGKPVERHLCGPPGALDEPRGTLPNGSLTGAIALVIRGICPFEEKAEQAKLAGATGIVFADNREGEANGIPVSLALSRRLDREPRRRPAARVHGSARRQDDRARRPQPARARDRAQRRDHELLVGRPDCVRPRPEAGHLCARRPDPLGHASQHERIAVRGLRRYFDGHSARRRLRSPAAAAASQLDAGADQVGTRLDCRAGLGRHCAHAGKRP